MYLFADTHAAWNVNTEHHNGLINAATACGCCRRSWLQHVRHVSQLWNLLGQNVDHVLLVAELTFPDLNTLQAAALPRCKGVVHIKEHHIRPSGWLYAIANVINANTE